MVCTHTYFEVNKTYDGRDRVYVTDTRRNGDK